MGNEQLVMSNEEEEKTSRGGAEDAEGRGNDMEEEE
jgi:hypothetical protein